MLISISCGGLRSQRAATMLQIASFSIIGVKRLDSFCYAAPFYLVIHCEPRCLVCHAICMSIVLSHNTAKAVYQAAYSVSAIGTEPCSPAKIYGARPSKELLDSAADWLARHNVALDNDAPLDTTVFERANVRSMTGCKCHVSSKRFAGSRFIKLADDIYIVGVELCALQAATYLPFRELVEYYFELCGAYSLGHDASTSYTERFALTSTSSLKHFFNSLIDCKGLELARKAIQCVRDGCRSPMETAFVMMLTLPRREGGLGISEIETDYEVKVTAAAKNLTRREKFYMDAYLKRSRTDIEYNGFQHDAEEDRAIDEERKNALASMGYGIITVSRYSFMHASAFARVMEAIQRKEAFAHRACPKISQSSKKSCDNLCSGDLSRKRSVLRSSSVKTQRRVMHLSSSAQCSRASRWTTRRSTMSRPSTTCKSSSWIARSSPKQAPPHPKAGCTGPEQRRTDRVGTPATCKNGSFQQSRVSEGGRIAPFCTEAAIFDVS